MKSLYIRRFLALSALALALPVGSAYAAMEGRGAQAGEPDCAMEQGSGHRGGLAMHGLRQLDLSAEQQKQMRLLKDAQEDANRPLMRDLREARIALRDLGTAERFDEKKAAELSDNIGRLHGKLALSMAQGHQKMLAILTPEQRAKLNTLPAMQHRHRR